MKRFPKLLKAAEGTPCMNYGSVGTTVAAHANEIIYGKGIGIKAHDAATAHLCHICHARLDNGNDLTKQERFIFWHRAYVKTMIYRFDMGIIRV